MIEKTRFEFFYFDLEETLIDSYVDMNTMIPINTNLKFVNVEKVLNFIKENNIQTVDLYSFAMQNSSLIGFFDDDLHYNKSVRTKVEEKFGIKIIKNIPLTDMIKKSSKLRRLDTISFRDYFQHYSKQQSFIDMVRYKIKFQNETDSTYTLLDDMVENVILYYPDANVYAKLVNVNSLK